MQYTTEQLLNRAKSLDTFQGIPKDYWILGMRSNRDQPNVFDDKYYIYKGEICVDVITGTTNPGMPSLMKPMNPKGAAVVKSNMWYPLVWTRGLHKGKVPALVQTGKFLIIRDNNKNNIAGDAGTESWESGIGINFHPNTYNLLNTLKSVLIGDWSHGSQVPNDVPKYKNFLEVSKPQVHFTYCLLQEF